MPKDPTWPKNDYRWLSSFDLRNNYLKIDYHGNKLESSLYRPHKNFAPTLVYLPWLGTIGYLTTKQGGYNGKDPQIVCW